MNRVAVIGGGISGLATAYSIQQKTEEIGLPAKVFLIEKDTRLGGKIKTDNIDGWICENGPLGYIDNKPEVSALIDRLGMRDDLVVSSDAARKRYVFIDGKLQKLPDSPPAFIKTKLLSWSAKLRIARELWTRPAISEKDESIADFARRHLGDEATEKLISAMVVGIFAGDASELSLDSSLPVMRALEREGDGSLIKAMIRRQRAKKAAAKSGGEVVASDGPRSEGMVGSTGKLTTFSGGMNRIIDVLQDRFEGEIKSGVGARALAADGEGYAIELEDGYQLPVDSVIFACPARQAAKILKGFDEKLADLYDEIPYVPVNVVVFGYAKNTIGHDLDGFGFLAPKRENRGILGCLWNTSIFSGQAPAGKAALRVMLGGAIKPETTKLDDERTFKLVQEELRGTMGIVSDPEFTRVFRHERAIPQYTIGHGDRLKSMEAAIAGHPGLFLSGNALRGVSFNDCVINADATAQRLADYLKRKESSRSGPA